MDQTLVQSFRQFDSQTNDRVISHIRMSNLYLQIERGEIELTRDTANDLWLLMRQTYPDDLFGRNYWEGEFEKLDSWDTV